MCGIAGILSRKRLSNTDDESIQAMGDAIAHRGPDGARTFKSRDGKVAFIHRRLSIIDLSENGSQPMDSVCGSLTLAYNGEIYNYKSLKNELVQSGSTFNGTSDTEVLLEGIRKWGLQSTLEKSAGMFALALWNHREKVLSIARDRVGIKPLYWFKDSDQLCFSSELKSLIKHPSCPTEIDRDSISTYMRNGRIEAPYSVYKNVYKLLPGHIQTIDSWLEISDTQFWSMESTYNSNSSKIDLNEAINLNSETNRLEHLLHTVIEEHMISDVPLGAFLSGGIDSSLVVSIMQKISRIPIKTYCIGFDSMIHNEAEFAKSTAEVLGTEHTELYATSKDAQEIIPKLPNIYDEPFSDPSQIPTFLVSKLTRDHVTVALSGDGGDELFAGYQRYQKIQKYRPFLDKSFITRKVTAKSIKSAALLYKINPSILPQKIRSILETGKIGNIDSMLNDSTGLALYHAFASHCNSPDDYVLGGKERKSDYWYEASKLDFHDGYSPFQYIDSVTYLPDEILTKLDRASMAVSLEARVPLLDHRVIEHAWSLNQKLKVDNGKQKIILKELLSRYLPKNQFDKPKQGFAIPINSWISDPLLDWSEELLSEATLIKTGLLNPEKVRQLWQAHKSQSINAEFRIWDILMLQSWATSQGI